MTVFEESVQTPPRTPTTAGAAQALAAVIAPLFGGTMPVRIRAWDGSEAGPVDAPVAIIRSQNALRRLLFHPSELGLAQAYVMGELDVEGDLRDGLRSVWQNARDKGINAVRPGPAQFARALKTAKDLGVLGRPLPAPASQAQLGGKLHGLRRDRAAISHHYDLSNDFYALVLDPHMAYSCAYWTSNDPDYTLQDAQRDKLDLVCRKLGLQPGMRLLDVGCGWGSLTLYAAEHYGVQVVGVTLSREQRDYVREQIQERGLGDRVEVRLQDYRAVDDGTYDAVASLEMGEHVGQANYPVYAGQLHRLVRPGGRVLIQQMSRKDRPGGGAFIQSFIAPDMYMRPVGETVAFLEDAGLEVRDVHSIREHYVRTVDAWYDTFQNRWDEVVTMVGEEVARVWRLYLVGGALSFEEGRMGVDQILAIRRTVDGRNTMPPVRSDLLST
jgi:cyclopropane-fatty-acyl-phospholipid synthase